MDQARLSVTTSPALDLRRQMRPDAVRVGGEPASTRDGELALHRDRVKQEEGDEAEHGAGKSLEQNGTAPT